MGCAAATRTGSTADAGLRARLHQTAQAHKRHPRHARSTAAEAHLTKKKTPRLTEETAVINRRLWPSLKYHVERRFRRAAKVRESSFSHHFPDALLASLRAQ